MQAANVAAADASDPAVAATMRRARRRSAGEKHDARIRPEVVPLGVSIAPMHQRLQNIGVLGLGADPKRSRVKEANMTKDKGNGVLEHTTIPTTPCACHSGEEASAGTRLSCSTFRAAARMQATTPLGVSKGSVTASSSASAVSDATKSGSRGSNATHLGITFRPSSRLAPHPKPNPT